MQELVLSEILGGKVQGILVCIFQYSAAIDFQTSTS